MLVSNASVLTRKQRISLQMDLQVVPEIQMWHQKALLSNHLRDKISISLEGALKLKISALFKHWCVRTLVI